MKIAFNWGHKLILVFILFGAGMSWLVYQCVHTNFDLVSKEYYKDELEYQRVIDAKRNWNALDATIETRQLGKVIEIQFPSAFQGTPLTGTALFYCTVDAKRDRGFELAAGADGRQLVDASQLQPGKYTIKLNWTAGSRSYYTEQTIRVQ